MWGEEKLPVANLKYGLAADSMALTVGLKDGDKITAVNNKPLVYQNDLARSMLLNDKVSLSVNRQGRDTTIIFPEGFLSDLTKNQLKDFVTVRAPVIIDSVDPKSIKYVSGNFEKGDRIIGIEDHPFEYFHEFDEVKKQYKGKEVEITALRNEKDTVLVKVQLNDVGNIGILSRSPEKLFGTEKKEYSFFQAIPAGINYGVTRLGEYMRGIRLLFTSKEHRVQDNLGSVISIGKTFGGVWDWQRFWMMTALFSIILAFMNILPRPALDGGHALFTIYEIVSGRKPSDKFMEYAQMVGMILLLGLMAYALGLDIFRLFK
jgi:regulator of sigma E protease